MKNVNYMLPDSLTLSDYMPWLPGCMNRLRSGPFYILFWFEITKQTVPVLTCLYNCRSFSYHLTLASGLTGYRWNSSAPFLVTDYMCLIQDAFPVIRFEWRFSFVFYFDERPFFVLKKKDCLLWKTALSCNFFCFSIDNLGPYMCYTNCISFVFIFIE